MPFVASLRAFKRVVDDCLSMELKESFSSSSREFEKKYRELKMSITPKVSLKILKMYAGTSVTFQVHIIVISDIEHFLEVKDEKEGSDSGVSKPSRAVIIISK